MAKVERTVEARMDFVMCGRSTYEYDLEVLDPLCRLTRSE